MKKLIISNNPLANNLADTEYISGSPADVMRVARARVHGGWKLWAHPLLGNIRLLRNPFRSVVLCNANITDNAALIEDVCWKLSQADFDNSPARSADYQYIDYELLRACL